MASDLALSYHSLDFWQVSDDGVTPVINSHVNTWDDWHLVPSARPIFSPPEVKSKFIEVPAYNGYLDLTDIYANGIIYGARTGDLTFLALLPPPGQSYGNWAARNRIIEDYVHGKLLYVAISEDPNYWLFGRWTFSWTNTNDGKASGSCTFQYNLQPRRIPRLISANNLPSNRDIVPLDRFARGGVGSGGSGIGEYVSTEFTSS